MMEAWTEGGSVGDAMQEQVESATTMSEFR
jgi:hypothetical protein